MEKTCVAEMEKGVQGSEQFAASILTIDAQRKVATSGTDMDISYLLGKIRKQGAAPRSRAVVLSSSSCRRRRLPDFDLAAKRLPMPAKRVPRGALRLTAS